MTPAELVDIKESPGPNFVFATDPASNKDWQTAESVVRAVSPLQKFFAASSSWAWNHALGYRPTVDVYNSAWEKVGTGVVQTDENNLSVTFQYNAEGYVLLR